MWKLTNYLVNTKWSCEDWSWASDPRYLTPELTIISTVLDPLEPGQHTWHAATALRGWVTDNRVEPNYGVRQRETCKAGEAMTVTAVKSNRAFPESPGDQAHPSENEERAGQLAQRKPRKRRQRERQHVLPGSILTQGSRSWGQNLQNAMYDDAWALHGTSHRDRPSGTRGDVWE